MIKGPAPLVKKMDVEMLTFMLFCYDSMIFNISHFHGQHIPSLSFLFLDWKYQWIIFSFFKNFSPFCYYPNVIYFLIDEKNVSIFVYVELATLCRV